MHTRNQRADMFILMYSKYFESHHLMDIRTKIENMDESKWIYFQTAQFKDPTTILIISILIGSLGIDRFMIGDVGLGIAKLVTCGGLGIWQIIDWFLIMDATREKNYEKFNEIYMGIA